MIIHTKKKAKIHIHKRQEKCDNYDDVLALADVEGIRVADMSMGKAKDDGYRGIHVYFQKTGSHYPIEIQYNTYYDRQFNNWLHKYIYKKEYDDSGGNDDYFITAEISEEEYEQINREYPDKIAAGLEVATLFKKKYIEEHLVLLEGWNDLL